MPTPTYPILFPQPWCSGSGAYLGSKNSTVISTSSIQPLASLNDGFPSVTMQALNAGGVPPSGADFNGILNLITSHLTWLSSGGQYAWSSAQASATGNYLPGAVLLLQAPSPSANQASVICTVANSNNPSVATPNFYSLGWWPYSGQYVLGATVATAATIVPTSDMFHLTGSVTISTITLPYTGFTGTLMMIPNANVSTATGGNIALASSLLANKPVFMTYDGTAWYPSY